MSLPPRLFCDSSFFYACFNPFERNHARAHELGEGAAAAGTSLFTTWDIVSETVTLLRYRTSFDDTLVFLDEVKPRLRIVTYGNRVRTEAEELFRRRARHRRLSLCDAISFVVVTTILDQMPCLAFDRDFRGLGLTVIV